MKRPFEHTNFNATSPVSFRKLTLLIVPALILTMGCLAANGQQRSPDVEGTTAPAAKVSHFTFPVVIPFAPVRKLAEEKLKERLEEPIPVDVSQYGVTLKNIEAKSSEISSVEWNDGHIEWVVKVKGKYSASALKIPFVGSIEGRIIIQQTLSATTNYSLHSESKVILKKLDFTAMAVPISKSDTIKEMVRSGVLEALDDTTDMIDSLVNEQTWFQDALEPQLQSLGSGIKVSSMPDFWLQLSPVAARVPTISGNITNLILRLDVDAIINATFAQPKPVTVKLPVLTNKQTEQPHSIVANLPLRATYEEWTSLLRPILAGSEREVGDETTVKILDCQITRNGTGVGIRLPFESTGKIKSKGEMNLYGIPKYDSTHRRIVVADLNYDLATKNVLLKTGDWVFHEKYRAFIAETVAYGLDELSTMLGGDAQVWPLNEGVKLEAGSLQYNVSELRVEKDGLAINGQLTGKISVIVDAKELTAN